MKIGNLMAWLGDAFALLSVLVAGLVALADRAGGGINWLKVLAIFFPMLAISEFLKRHTTLKSLEENVARLAAAKTKVESYKTRTEFYSGLQNRISQARREVIDTTWGPEVAEKTGRASYRKAAKEIAEKVQYKEVYSISSEGRLVDLRDTLRERSATGDEVYVVDVQKAPIPDMVVIDRSILMIGLPHVKGEGTGCFLEIHDEQIAALFREFLSDCCDGAERVVLNGSDVVFRSSGRPVTYA